MAAEYETLVLRIIVRAIVELFTILFFLWCTFRALGELHCNWVSPATARYMGLRSIKKTFFFIVSLLWRNMHYNKVTNKTLAHNGNLFIGNRIS